MSLRDIADYIGHNVPAILQKKSLSPGRQVSAAGGGLPLIIQQVLEKVVEWANPDQRPKYEVCHQVSSYTVVFRASANACYGYMNGECHSCPFWSLCIIFACISIMLFTWIDVFTKCRHSILYYIHAHIIRPLEIGSHRSHAFRATANFALKTKKLMTYLKFSILQSVPCALELQAEFVYLLMHALQFSLCMMIATLVSSFIHSSKTVLAMSAEDGRISSSHVP